MYDQKILERFSNPKFAGEIIDADGIGQVGNFKCGDIMKVFIKVTENKIEDIKFKTYGCVAAIASSDYLCELALHKDLEFAEKISAKDIVEKMGDLPDIKYHCSILANNALREAIKNYRQNKNFN